MSTGPLTYEQLMALWESVVDTAYSQPLLENPDSGIELVQQAALQFERVSKAIDTSTQAMFLLPWSGQSSEPAQFGAKAKVFIRFARDIELQRTVTLLPSVVKVLHITEDMSEEGPVVVETGRVYVDIDKSLTFAGGDPGPYNVLFEAEKEGYGYNNPLPNSITRIEQIGGGFNNTGARLIVEEASMLVRCKPSPDVFVPEHVGQYLRIESGTQKGQIRRISIYNPPPLPPDPASLINGGEVYLQPTLIVRVNVISGVFEKDEVVEQIDMASNPNVNPNITNARGIFRALTSTGVMTIDVIPGGTFFPGTPTLPYIMRRIYGQTSLAIAEFVAVNPIEQQPYLTTDLNVAWRVLTWEELGIHVTNLDSPTGGKSALLNEIGYGRDLPRTAGEDADIYRNRIAAPADCVSPNAVRRACNRLLEYLGLSIILHEIGLPSFRGLFYDVEPNFSQFDPAFAFFYDNDSIYIGDSPPV